ncbi:MAG: hypothetical protein LWW93_01460 [Hyphomicrobiales bacterium]|nr:hypothetical protein [Hyphomicrobiales bacterium]
MSNEKTQVPQYQQQNPTVSKNDALLDAQYKPIGIPAVSAATAQMHFKPKKTDDQWS